MKNKKSVILLSGGLDSTVSLAVSKEEYNIELALTFDYGQKPASEEIEAAARISKYYNIRHEVIQLPFLAKISSASLVSDADIPKENLGTKESAKAVWIPNRNGLFLNIAAAYADSYGFSHVIFGANKEEAQTFPDNTKEFTQAVTKSFEYSTLVQAEAFAPLIDCDKIEIAGLALEHKAPLEMIKSCYEAGGKNCGECESCKRFKAALEHHKAYDYIKRLFK